MARARLTYWERLLVDAEINFFPFGKYSALIRNHVITPIILLGCSYGLYKHNQSEFPLHRRLVAADDAASSKSFLLHNKSDVSVRVDRLEVRMDPKTVKEASWVKHFGRHYLPLELAWSTYGDPKCTAAIARNHERYAVAPGESLPLVTVEEDDCAESLKYFFNHVSKVRLWYWEYPEVLCKEVVEKPSGLWPTKKTVLDVLAAERAEALAAEEQRKAAKALLRQYQTGQKEQPAKGHQAW